MRSGGVRTALVRRSSDEMAEEGAEGQPLVPANAKVAEREAFGNHYGTVYFKGDDPDKMRELLVHYDQVDFYLDEAAPAEDSADGGAGAGSEASAPA